MQHKSAKIDLDDGPWRDGWYVVASVTTQMPRRCMICGADVKALNRTAVLLPKHARGIISGSFALIAGERINVCHGRCDRHRTAWSYYIGIATGIISILSLIAFAVAMYANEDRMGPLQAVLIGTFGASAVVTVWLAMTNLRIDRTDGTYIWIGGFGRGFRDKLPLLRKAS
jgi:hypothetical protein